MDNLDFVAIANGLEVSFRVLTKVQPRPFLTGTLVMIRGPFMMLNNLLILMKSPDSIQ